MIDFERSELCMIDFEGLRGVPAWGDRVSGG
jgi:hypothetical protein